MFSFFHPRLLYHIFVRLSIALFGNSISLPPITLHEARHTAATLLAEVWPSPKEAQKILGHSSITTTLQIYTHSSQRKMANALNALAQRVAPPEDDLEEMRNDTADSPMESARVLYRMV
jgi:integrase